MRYIDDVIAIEGLVSAHGGVYAIGGSKLNPSYDDVAFLNLSVGVAAVWTPVAPLNKARCWPMVAAITGTDGREMVVAAGGLSLVPMFQPMASVEVYDKDTDSWTLLEDPSRGALPAPIGFGSGAALNATHMIAGGGAGPGVSGAEEYTFALD